MSANGSGALSASEDVVVDAARLPTFELDFGFDDQDEPTSVTVYAPDADDVSTSWIRGPRVVASEVPTVIERRDGPTDKGLGSVRRPDPHGTPHSTDRVRATAGWTAARWALLAGC